MNVTSSAAPSSSLCAPSSQPWVLAATILGSSMVFIDGTVVNVALAAFQTDLGATAVDVQWVVEAYALLLASLLLVGGSLGDAHGRRRIYLVGVVVFAAASMWCGLAPDIDQLIYARVVQGTGAALLVPGSLAIISASFSVRDRGRAIGTWSGFTAITAAVGPVIGGWLIEHASWRWVFFINLPLALIVLALTMRHVPESRNPRAGRQDWPGAFLATAGLCGLTYAFIESSNRGWDDMVVLATLLGGVFALILFLLVESRARSPLLPLSLFSSRNFSGTNLLTFFLYSALGGSLFFFPLNLIQVQGYSATAAGAAFLPFIVLMFLLSRWSGGLVDRYGAKLPLVIGPMVAAVGFAMFALPSVGGSYWTTFFPAVLVLGLGMSITVAPLTTTVMNAVGDDLAGIASGVNNSVSRVAAVLAVAVLGVVMLGTFSRQLSGQLNGIPLSAGVRQQLDEQNIRLGAIEIPGLIGQETHAMIQQSIRQSFVAGFRLVMMLASGLAIMSSTFAWLIIGNREQRTETSDQRTSEPL